MAIFVRNQRSLDSSVTTAQFWSRHLVLIRELFLAGRWTQNTISGGPWDANIVISRTDISVNPASPGRIVTATGGTFNSSHVGYAITLYGGATDDDQNRGVYRIAIVHSDTEIEVEYPPPDNWIADTGMTGRVFNWGAGTVLGNAEYVVMDPPAGSGGTSQAYISKPTTDYHASFAAHPRGDYPNNQTLLTALNVSSSERRARWNAYFDGTTAFIFFRVDNQNIWWGMLWGELDDTDAADLYPGFFSSGTSTSMWNLINGDLSILRMLYDDGGIGQINGRIAAVCRGTLNGGNAQSFGAPRRSVKGKAQLVKPWVYMEGANGGFFRGRHPFRYTNYYWESWRPMDPSGVWLHYNETGVFPRNGVNDPRPINNAG